MGIDQLKLTWYLMKLSFNIYITKLEISHLKLEIYYLSNHYNINLPIHLMRYIYKDRGKLSLKNYGMGTLFDTQKLFMVHFLSAIPKSSYFGNYR